MKFKLSILGLVLLISSIVVGIVKAEDLKCKTMSNGVWHNNITSEDKKLEHDFRPLCQNVLTKFSDDRKISN